MSDERGTREMSRHMSAAEVVRAMGWGVGTHLVGDEGYGPTTIQITAVGENEILARPVDSKRFREGTWTLAHRDWKEVKP